MIFYGYTILNHDNDILHKDGLLHQEFSKKDINKFKIYTRENNAIDEKTKMEEFYRSEKYSKHKDKKFYNESNKNLKVAKVIITIMEYKQ